MLWCSKNGTIADLHQDLKTQVFFYLEVVLMEYFLEAVSTSIRKRILKSYTQFAIFFRIFEHCEKWLLCYCE